MKTLRLSKKALTSWAAACLVVTLSFIALGAIITGTPGADLLVGTAANDTINGRGGPDLIIDLGGNDQINTHTALAPLEAPGPVDIVIDLAGNDRIFGGPGLLDIIIDIAGNNTISTGGGLADLVFTGPGNDKVSGASAAGVASIIDVFIDFGGGSNVLNGNGGLADIIFGGPGNDTLTGGASLVNVLLADFTFTGTDRNVMKAQAGAAFGIPGVSVLIDSFGPDTMTGGNNSLDFIFGIFGAPVTSQNVLNGGNESFTTLPFPGDFLVGGIGRDVYFPGKGFDFSLDPLGGNDTFVLRPGDTIAGTFELVFCGGPGTDRDTVQLKGFNVRTTVVTPVLSSGLPGTIAGDILALVTDPNSGAFSGYALVFCEVRTFTR